MRGHKETECNFIRGLAIHDEKRIYLRKKSVSAACLGTCGENCYSAKGRVPESRGEKG